MARSTVLRVDIIGNARRLRSELGEADSALGRFGRGAVGAGKLVGGAMLGIGVAVAGAATVAVQAASDQQQAFGALESVYGKNAATVKRWAEGAAEAVGLSTTSYANLSAVVGSQLQSMGQSQAEAAKQSDELIKIGADLSATFGGDVSEAVSAVGSLLRGEADPIERYGVSIKQSDVNARLAAQGLDGLTGKARTQAEAQAKLALLTEQTKNAQGAFGREANTLAGQQQRLTAELDNVKAALGARLLPIATSAVSFLREEFVPIAQEFAGKLATELGPAIDSVGAFLTDTLIPAGKQAWIMFRDEGLPVITQVGSFIRENLVPAFRSIATFVLERLVPAIQSGLKPVLAGVKSLFGQVQGAIDRNRPTLEKFGRIVQNVAGWLAEKLAPIMGTLAGTGFKTLGLAISGAIDLFALLFNGIDAVIGILRDLLGWLDKVTGPLQSVGGFLGGAVGAVFGGTELATGAPGLTGGAAPLSAGHELAHAASSLEGGLSILSARPPAAAGAVYVDRRAAITVNVDGALDPTAVARQLEDILAAQVRRLAGR